LGLLVAFVCMGAFAEWLAPHPTDTGILSDRLRPPFWQEGGARSLFLGTDLLGRDILSRIIFGARVSLVAALVTVSLGAGVGSLLGLLSGYYGGWTDTIIMRLADAMLSIPIILLALLFAVLFGPSLSNVVIVLALAMWARFARLVRGEALSWKERDFVTLARCIGASDLRIIFRHLLPNVMNPMIVLATLQLSWVIILEASLSFLGAGVPPHVPSWGIMVSEGRAYLTTAWWLSVFPGLAIALLVFSFNLLSDWVRDRLDPRTQYL
jgi:peptide/nickel transport system permease protein